MHKPNMMRISLLLILGVTQIQSQRGPPPPGYFGRSRSPPQPPQTKPYFPSSPQQRQFVSPYYGTSSPKPQQYFGASQQQPSYRKPPKSSGPSNIVGWLGSQMAKTFPGLNRGRYPTPQKYKQTYGRSPPTGASSFGTPSPSGFGGAGVNSISSGSPGQGVSHVYFPPGAPPTPHPGMTPQNTIFQVIAADGSSRYQASPPVGYENFFNQGGVVRQALSQSHQHQYQAPQPQQYQQQAPISYQYQQAPGQYPLQGTKSTGNIEVFPSQMVSYEKQTLSTGHPEYQSAVDGMVTAASSPSNAHGYPVYYQLQQPFQQQQPLPQFYSQQQNQQFRGQGENSQVQSMLQGVSPDVAPILDLSTLENQQYQQDMSSAASSNPEPQVMEEVQSPQQQQQQSEQSHNNPSPSFLGNQDTSSDYSQAALSVVPPPSNFQYQRQMDNMEHQDMQGAESNNYQQVQVLSQHGSGNGNFNPSFEILADANAPTYDGGHPIDISQLIQQIEPGAQVDPKDIVAEAQENGQAQRQEYGVRRTTNNEKKRRPSNVKFPDDIQTPDQYPDSTKLLNIEQFDIRMTTPNIPKTSHFQLLQQTVQPQISSTETILKSNTSLTYNDSHKTSYSRRVTTPTPSFLFIPSKIVEVGFPVNPLFDKVLSSDNEFEEKSDDEEVDESRQVLQYAITVTPPTHMFENGKVSKSVKNDRTVTSIGLSSKNILNSNYTLNSGLSKTQVPQKRFPVYQRKS